MGSNHMHDLFRNSKYLNLKNKFPIPEYDPQTGERNPHYEELTNESHPEDKDKNKIQEAPEGSELAVLNKWLRMLADADIGIRRKLVCMNRFRDTINKMKNKGD